MKENKLINVIIADDDPYARKGLESVLKNIPSVKKITHAENGRQVIELLEKEFYNIVFMDVKMPELDGVTATAHIHNHFRKVNVIAFTIHDTDDMLIQMYDSGAMGYVLKSDNETRIGSAIEAVLSGNYYFAGGMERITRHIEEAAHTHTFGKRDDSLTGAEKEVLIGICDEHSLKEIEVVMHISESKVKYHHSRLLFKTGVKNTAGLVKYAIREGIYKDNVFTEFKRLFRSALER